MQSLVFTSDSSTSTSIRNSCQVKTNRNASTSRECKTLTNAVSGQSQNCSGNLEISPGIGTLGNFSGKHAIIRDIAEKNLRIYVGNSKNFREGNPKIREDDPNFRDDLC